uniref:Glycosyltransferase, catalytic subunit of cellulose synthase and poly-beta-1,6-N-acetylglucosamine synthase n=1 Tax=Candidatus Kentrum sp. MB TaxID=2138164 RepID=A0A450XJB2_9GAMM|nr:MAG: Glycosyltransferase, catalytic subunit of cellulose synthase and poly-beta-1,6-N-acetylglucosamine synthase [Candidatus Kentron sp. MB]VFK33514.1 MAG: Glycosyltransferase, catalytic subunit of cellulose synthase and poly-beta-1,6-N-acetylglucosamine synthase [Candidatus Kentron sp. MB]VFK76247.1 MAG: Glycosyltransferase, catalytic subunit of cellulose synthase and poly-beta-1,6-N-acetylglucosamine synthase [Candidatus Kentron sp. MB]
MNIPESLSPERIRQTNGYLRKHQLAPLQTLTPPRPDLGLAVVIPCHNEPDLESVLAYLWRCVRPACGVEVIVVVNAAPTDAPAIHAQNRRTIALAGKWIARHRDDRLRFYILHFPNLPSRHAGVGLARRLGMDEAVARFAAIDNPDDAIIACLDADCGCDENYLTALVTHFSSHPKTPGCSIYFEHPLDPESPHHPALAPAERAAIAGYELHLRYYVHGLRYAGSPYAYHTVGSCMAVRARIYQAQGGMNRRKAGEDFYFLQKIAGLGNFTQLPHTRVLPSPRLSERVPFGTGQAIRSSLARDDIAFTSYAPAVFRDLRTLLGRFRDLYAIINSNSLTDGALTTSLTTGLPPYVSAFLNAQGFETRCAEIRRNAASPANFEKRFHRWFNAFLTLKFIHFATAHSYPKVPVEQGAHTLLQWSESKKSSIEGENHLPQRETLLLRYRALDRGEKG